ncbi:MAG: class I SAM-dependent methyltransferase [Chloroflexi bacterium]|nr:class I SAM-dependent methyltransferase [Chloroflexota bacterium]
MGPRVLEVGAGLGASTRQFADYDCQTWVALEPDPELVAVLHQHQADQVLPAHCVIREGTLAALDETDTFDTILYIDVLEHIEADRQEVAAAARHLKPGGYLVVLSPAFQFLYTPFDEAIGHYRRYTKKTIGQLSPENCQVVRGYYLDAVGMLPSVGNLLFLKSPQPSLNQIRFWDRFLVPVSRVVDRLVGYRFGRSIVYVWQRTG